VTRPDRTAWEAALRLAGGDRHRIQVIGERDLLVHNSREWRLHVTKKGRVTAMLRPVAS
jgi:hypothetical protein